MSSRLIHYSFVSPIFRSRAAALRRPLKLGSGFVAKGQEGVRAAHCVPFLAICVMMLGFFVLPDSEVLILL